MKLRFVLPVALIGAAIAMPLGADADPSGICPDHFTPTIVVFQPEWAEKDHNGNFIVCHKDVPGQGDPTKDDNGFIIETLEDPNETNWIDDPGLGL
jgi:hypothetical protein